MTQNILIANNRISKLQPNLWLASGHVIGYGSLLSPGGLYYCFSCNRADCSQTQVVNEAWASGQDSAEQPIPFDGYVEDDEGMLFASSADLYGLNEWTL